MKVYLAGALFSKADQKERIYEGEQLKKIEGLEVFNPLTDNPSNDKSKLPTAQDIFINDTYEVLDSDIIVANLDNSDPGVMMELGIAYGVNSVKEYFNTLLEAEKSPNEIVDCLKMYFPTKKVYAHLSDLRLQTAGDYEKHYVPYGYNAYVIGGIEEMGRVYYSFEDVLENIKKDNEV